MGKHQPHPDSIKPRKVSRRQRMAIDDAKAALRGDIVITTSHPVATAYGFLALCEAKDRADGVPPMEYKRDPELVHWF